METLEVRGHTLHIDWFCGKRSMEAFAYAIEVLYKMKEALGNGSIISDGYDMYKVEDCKVNIEGIFSSVMIAQTDFAGSTTCADTGKIYLTKKGVKEFINTLNFLKQVKVSF